MAIPEFLGTALVLYLAKCWHDWFMKGAKPIAILLEVKTTRAAAPEEPALDFNEQVRLLKDMGFDQETAFRMAKDALPPGAAIPITADPPMVEPLQGGQSADALFELMKATEAHLKKNLSSATEANRRHTPGGAFVPKPWDSTELEK